MNEEELINLVENTLRQWAINAHETKVLDPKTFEEVLEDTIEHFTEKLNLRLFD
jgi:hypothetical protein